MDSTDKTELYTPAEVDVDEKIAAMRAEIDAQKSINSSLSRLTSGMQAEIDEAKDMERGYKERHGLMQAEIDELKMNLSHSINNSDAREYKLQTEIDGLKFMLRRILLETMHDPITRKTFSRAELLCDQTQE